MSEPWYTQRLRCKPGKAVVRLYNDDGTFLGVVNTPSVLWPLSGPYEVFSAETCKIIENNVVANAVDTVPYHIGHCYQNAEAVVQALQKAGYAATQYCGWLFVGEQYPIHHSWVVLDGIHVIDLADEFSVLHANQAQFDKTEGLQAARELMVEFTRWIQQFPNSQRIMPFGIPSRNLLYIGAPCSGKDGIAQYNKLSKSFPSHPCNERLLRGQAKTKMQAMLQDAGLMD